MRAQHSSLSKTIVKDFRDMDREKFEDVYGVTVDVNNPNNTTIHDPIYNRTFKNVHEWIAHCEEQEGGERGGFQRGSEKYAFDDEV